MNAVIGIFIFGAAVAIATPFLNNLPSVKRRFHEMDDKGLVSHYIRAHISTKRLLILAVCTPVIFGFLISQLNEEYTKTFLMAVGLVLIFAEISGFEAYWEIKSIAKSEIESRKLQKEGAV